VVTFRPWSGRVPGLPIKKGPRGNYDAHYKRNGTITLFAALDTLQGKLVGDCLSRHLP
jgi:hypothetical protein